jgi:hypothetical protein
MSDFWGLSSGEQVKATNEFESAGGSMQPIPDGTQVLAAIDEAKWDNKDDNEYISLRWSVLKPDAYKNRKVFQKLWVMGNNPSHKDPKKQGDTAKKMLAAIDTNCGGNLMTGGKPSDTDLQANLLSKPMVVKLAVWEMTGSTGETMSGNWVQMVAPKEKGVSEVQPKPSPAASVGAVDDEIPF